MPLPLRQIPNLITSIRILLVAPIALALAHRQWLSAIILFGAAAFSDLADGFLAKRYGWQSELGSVLDPIADKLLMASAFITLAHLELVPRWLMGAVVTRDVVIVGGALAYRFWIGPIQGQPSLVSKLNTLCQAALIMAIVGREQFALPAAWAVTLLGALVFVTVVVSGIDYVLVWGPRVLEAPRARHGSAAGTADRRP